MREKRIAAIHDISCFGKCSLTVALPIISAAGVETAVIPTAVLSTHTGGLSGYTYRDLTADIMPIAEHWQSLGLSFDGIYTGFLGSFEQIDIVRGVISRLKGADTLVLVDPVMADDGVLYKVFTPGFENGMRCLCADADIITPNITEAALLLGEEYRKGPYARADIESMLKRLAALGAARVVLTGVYFDEESLGAAAYDARSGEINFHMAQRVPGGYHGTGDVFSSVLMAACMKGLPLSRAMAEAVDFTHEAILRTYLAKTDVRYGVNFEEGLCRLAQRLCMEGQHEEGR